MKQAYNDHNIEYMTKPLEKLKKIRMRKLPHHKSEYLFQTNNSELLPLSFLIYI